MAGTAQASHELRSGIPLIVTNDMRDQFPENTPENGDGQDDSPDRRRAAASHIRPGRHHDELSSHLEPSPEYQDHRVYGSGDICERILSQVRSATNHSFCAAWLIATLTRLPTTTPSNNPSCSRSKLETLLLLPNIQEPSP